MKISIFLLSAAGVFLSLTVQAAQVTQVKGNRVLLDLSGGMEGTVAGDELIAVDGNGKRKALLKVRQVKNNKATADITKGKADIGYTLTPRPQAVSRKESEEDSQDEGRSRRKSNGTTYGILGGYNQMQLAASFDVGSPSRTATTNMTGSNFGITGFYDFPLTSSLQIRAMGGLEQIGGSGSTTYPDCGNGTSETCSFSATYLSFYGQGKWNFYNEKTKAWVGLGFGYYMAMAKASNVLSESGLATNQVIDLGVGVDIPVGRRNKNFIPISFDYGMFPTSPTVSKANIMFLRAGYGWNL